jgi:hypothetical protein
MKIDEIELTITNCYNDKNGNKKDNNISKLESLSHFFSPLHVINIARLV